MENSDIEQLLLDSLEATAVHVRSEGSHYNIIVVSDSLHALSRVKRQQAVYAPLSDHIAAGTLHAISIKVFSQAEWQREKMLNGY